MGRPSFMRITIEQEAGAITAVRGRKLLFPGEGDLEIPWQLLYSWVGSDLPVQGFGTDGRVDEEVPSGQTCPTHASIAIQRSSTITVSVSCAVAANAAPRRL